MQDEIDEKQIIASEWGPSRRHTQRNGKGAWYLAAANHQVDLLYAMLRGRIKVAAYWPATDHTSPGIDYAPDLELKSIPELALLRRTESGYEKSAMGTIFEVLSISLAGKRSVDATWDQDGPSALAAGNVTSGQVVDSLTVFVQGRHFDKTKVKVDIASELVRNTAYRVTRAEVWYNNDPLAEAVDANRLKH